MSDNNSSSTNDTVLSTTTRYFKGIPPGIVAHVMNFLRFGEMLTLSVTCKQFVSIISNYNFRNSIIINRLGTCLNEGSDREIELPDEFRDLHFTKFMARIYNETANHLEKGIYVSWEIHQTQEEVTPCEKFLLCKFKGTSAQEDDDGDNQVCSMLIKKLVSQFDKKGNIKFSENDGSFLRSVFSKFKDAKIIGFHTLMINSASMEFLKDRGLKSLYLHDCYLPYDRFMPYDGFKPLDSLQHLYISSLPNFANISLGLPPNITKLQLRFYAKDYAFMPSYIASNECRSLEHIDIYTDDTSSKHKLAVYCSDPARIKTLICWLGKESLKLVCAEKVLSQLERVYFGRGKIKFWDPDRRKWLLVKKPAPLGSKL